MKDAIRIGCAAVGLVSVLALPLEARAVATERTYELRTRIVEQAPSVGEYDGSLQLHVSPAGIITGYYRADADARFVSVSGGVTGENFWIDIGALSVHPLHFSGTFANGKIDAQGNHPFFDRDRYATLELLAQPKSR